jgi:hypothetical protein
MIRSALIWKITIGVAPGLAAVMLAAAGATTAHASTQSVHHGATAATRSSASAQAVYHGATAAGAAPRSNIANCKAADPNRTDACWWVGANQTGKMHPVRDAISNWQTQKEATCQTGTWNDCASTLYNDNSRFGAFFFYNSGDGPPDFCMLPGTYLGDLTQFDYAGTTVPINDTISSNSWDTSGCQTT